LRCPSRHTTNCCPKTDSSLLLLLLLNSSSLLSSLLLSGAAQAQDAATCRSLFNQVGGLQGLTAFMPNCVPEAYNAAQCCQQVRALPLGAAVAWTACMGKLTALTHA
jgi:hypothetical protein